MKTRISFLLFFTGLSLWSQEYRSIIDEFIEKNNTHQSISYDIDYKIKTFDGDEYYPIKTSVIQKKIQGDSVFGGKFLYDTHHEIEDATYHFTKYYSGENLFVVAHHNKSITRYDSSKDEMFPITNSFDGEVIKVYFLNPEKLRELLGDEKNTVSFSETPDYWEIKIQYPNIDEFYGQERIIFINKATMLIDKILFQAQYLDQIQKDSWEFSNVIFDTVSDETFENKIKESLENYTVEDYVPLTDEDFELLELEEEAPEFSGILFPDYSTEVKIAFDKITILDFWFSSCHPCIKAIPHLNKIKEKYGDRIEVIGVNDVEYKLKDQSRIEAFLKRTPIEYSILMTEDVPEEYNVLVYPTLYIIGSDGKVKYAQIAYSDDMFDQLDEVIGKLVSE